MKMTREEQGNKSSDFRGLAIAIICLFAQTACRGVPSSARPSAPTDLSFTFGEMHLSSLPMGWFVGRSKNGKQQGIILTNELTSSAKTGKVKLALYNPKKLSSEERDYSQDAWSKSLKRFVESQNPKFINDYSGGKFIYRTDRIGVNSLFLVSGLNVNHQTYQADGFLVTPTHVVAIAMSFNTKTSYSALAGNDILKQVTFDK